MTYMPVYYCFGWHNKCAILCQVDKEYLVISQWTYNLQLLALFKIIIPNGLRMARFPRGKQMPWTHVEALYRSYMNAYIARATY